MTERARARRSHPNVSRRPTSAEERELIRRLKEPLGPAESPPPPEDPSAKVLAEAASKSPDEPMTVIVDLQALPYDFRSFSPPEGLADEARSQLVLDRKNQLRPMQNAFALDAAKWNATVEETRWLINQVIVRIPAGNVSKLIKIPNVVTLGLDEHTATSDGAYTGKNARDGARTQTFVDYGHTAKTGSRSGGAIRIGIAEATPFPRDHVGFSEFVNFLGAMVLFPRWLKYYDCTGTSCVTTTTNASGTTHGTVVAYAALGSIEAGQDSNFTGTNTLEQKKRSGQASGAHFYYYIVDTFASSVRALERAVSDGVDIMNHSRSNPYDIETTPCSVTENISNFNEAVRNAMSAGVLFVNTSGNKVDAAPCTLGYPSWRPEVLSVSGLNTSSDTTDYKSTSMSPTVASWSQGPVKIGVFGNPFGYLSGTGITLSAPGVYDGSKIYAAGPNSYGSGTWVGSSFAAPTVAGAAALLKSAFFDIGWGTVSPQVLYVNMLAQADGWSSVSNSFQKTKFDKISGAGRLNMHYPSNENLMVPWGWGWRSFTIHDGETVTWTVGDGTPRSPWTKEWSWALTWFEENLTSVADVDILVFDRCVPGSPAIAYDLGYDVRARIALKQGDISGKCLEMRAVGSSVPPAGRLVYSADFYHSGVASFAP